MNPRTSETRTFIIAMFTLFAAMGQGPRDNPKPDPANRPRYEQLKGELSDLERQLADVKASKLSADPGLALAEARKLKLDPEQNAARQEYLMQKNKLGSTASTTDYRDWEGLRRMLILSEASQRFLEAPENRQIAEPMAVVTIEQYRQPGRPHSEMIDQFVPKGDDPITPIQAMETVVKINKAQADSARPKAEDLASSLKLPVPLIDAFDESTRLQQEDTVYSQYIKEMNNQNDGGTTASLEKRIRDVAMELDRIWPGWDVEHAAELQAKSRMALPTSMAWVYVVNAVLLALVIAASIWWRWSSFKSNE